MRSIFKRSTIGLNLVFFLLDRLPYQGSHSALLFTYNWERTDVFMTLPRVLAL